MTQWSGGTVTLGADYDVDGRLSVVKQDGVNLWRYLYDARNRRVRKSSMSGSMPDYEVYGPGGELLGVYGWYWPQGASAPVFRAEEERIYFAGRVAARLDETGSPRWEKLDRLGSVKAWQRYPFGEGNESNWNDEYATYPVDRSTGHYYAWNRFYSATWGRFSSPDPYVMSGGLTNPQGWNRYSYVENDPVNLTDKTGLHLDQCADAEEAEINPYCLLRKRSAQPYNVAALVPHPEGGWYYVWTTGWVSLAPPVVSGRRTLTPYEAATMIGEEVKAGKITDCQGLVNFASYAATNYVGTKEEFVRSFGVFVPASHPMVKLANLLAGGAIASSPKVVLFTPADGLSGFKREYQDSITPGADQVHHFAAFLQFGYVAGALEAEIAAYLSDWNNPGDIRLGIRAAELGHALKIGDLKSGDIPRKILETLCK